MRLSIDSIGGMRMRVTNKVAGRYSIEDNVSFGKTESEESPEDNLATILGNDVVTVGDNFIDVIEVADDPDGLVAPPLDDRMVLDGDDRGEAPGLSPHSTPSQRLRVELHHQPGVSPPVTSHLALPPALLGVDTTSEGLLRHQDHSHRLGAALQTDCKHDHEREGLQ